ncbi:MAG: hypothetical protein GTO41_06475, partial [Burkholderiales bacterium]|nr:hypothetical protein [Burkholderiales bacterium]
MNVRYYLDLKSHLAAWIWSHRLNRTAPVADRLFRDVCGDRILAEYMASLPLRDLPQVRRALSLSLTQPGNEALETAVRAVIARDWRGLSPRQIDRASELYICCLGRALLPAAVKRRIDTDDARPDGMAKRVVG